MFILVKIFKNFKCYESLPNYAWWWKNTFFRKTYVHQYDAEKFIFLICSDKHSGKTNLLAIYDQFKYKNIYFYDLMNAPKMINCQEAYGGGPTH